MFKKKIFLLVFSLIILSGCLQQNIQIDTSLSKNIDLTFEQYQQGVNKLAEQSLENIIAEDFSYYGGGKSEYLNYLLGWTVFIDEIKWEALSMDDYKVLVEAKIKGTLVYKPATAPAIFKEQLPLLQGNFQKQSLFTLAYAKDGLKILSEDEGNNIKVFQKGDILPEIKSFYLDKYSAAPGDTVKVNLSFDKGANDVIFIYINERLLSGISDSGEVPYNEDSFSISIPLDYPRGKPFDIVALAYAGKLDLRNPRQAELQGIVAKAISIPIK